MAYIYDAVRTPRGIGKSKGSLHTTRSVDLGATVLRALKIRNDINTKYVEDIIFGCVTPVGEQGGNVAMSSAKQADFHDQVASVSVNRFCASGLESVNMATGSIMAGTNDVVIAGGVESMSRIPMTSDGGAWMIDPEIATQIGFVPQGISADLIATREGFSRAQVDDFAVQSQYRAKMAWDKGHFKNSIVAVKNHIGETLLDSDEHMRPQTTKESLGELKPAFMKLGTDFGFDSVAVQKYPELEFIHHVHHAGNSSGIVDGSAAILMGSEEGGKILGLKPRAKVRACAIVSTEPTIMLTGPTPAAKKALKKAGLTKDDIDLYEVNEAFAAVVMKFSQDMEIEMDKINVNGGAIAFGHPLGATGAILVNTLLDELERQNKNLGLVTLCVGGGMGIATVIERV